MGVGHGAFLPSVHGRFRAQLVDDGAGVVPCDGVGDVLQRRDDGAAAAGLDEAQRGLDLRAHAAAGELAGGGVLRAARRR